MFRINKSLRLVATLSALWFFVFAISSTAGMLYVRPPFNVKFFWPSSEWQLGMVKENETLNAILIKGEKKEEAVISIEGYNLGNLEAPDALLLFHWTMESDFAENLENFRRLTDLQEFSVSGKRGYREEISCTIDGDHIDGSIVSFADSTNYYQITLLAPSDVYREINADFQSMLGQIEFLEKPHPFAKFAPKTILGIEVPIVEAYSPAQDQLGFSLVAPKLEAYGSDTNRSILLQIEQEKDERTADKRALDLGIRTKEDLEDRLDVESFVHSKSSLIGIEVDYWECLFSRAENGYFLGLITWSFDDKVFLLRIIGPSEDFNHDDLTTAARDVLSRASP